MRASRNDDWRNLAAGGSRPECEGYETNRRRATAVTQADPGDDNSFELRKLPAIALRRRWWLLGPFFSLGLLGLIAAETWSLRYRSEARILVEQHVSEQYLAPNIVASMQTRLDSATQQVMSRDSLERISEQITKYAIEPSAMDTESMIDSLRRDLRIDVAPAQNRAGELATCTISYRSTSPRMAQRVTQLVTASFIDETLRSQTQQANDTTIFLESELQEAEKSVSRQRAELQAYERRFLGQLPNQQQSNLQILSSMQTQIEASTAALDRAEQQRIYLESMRSQYQALEDALASEQANRTRADGTPARSDAVERRLEEMRAELAGLRSRYMASHPDIRSLQVRIAELEQAPRNTAASPQASDQRVLRSNRIAMAEIDSRLSAITVEIATLRRRVQDLQQRLPAYEARLESAPIREQQLAELTRSYESARSHYDSLLQKKLQSGMASKLEERRKDERFVVLDPANLPTQPSGKRQIVLMGWVLGLGLGVALVAYREVADATIHDEDDLCRWTSLPFLGVVPVVRSAREQVRNAWIGRLEAAAVALLTIASGTLALRSLIGTL